VKKTGDNNHWITGLQNHWITGLQDYRITKINNRNPGTSNEEPEF